MSARREPDVKGPKAWCGWRLEDTRVTQGPAFVRGWVVELPGAHAAWMHWLLCCVDLAPHVGVPESHRQYAQAEYEVHFLALDPRDGKVLDPDDCNDFPGILVPIDLAVQFHGVSRVQAAEILDLCVQKIMSGTVSPDSDFRRWWERTIAGTVACLVQGTHPAQPS